MSVFENRVDYRLPFQEKFVFSTEDRVFAGTCQNISKGGGFIAILGEHGLESNTKCDCLFVLQENRKPIRVQGEVVRITAPSPNPSSVPGVGIRFIDVPDDTAQVITDYIDECRNQFEVISTILSQGEPEIRSLQPMLESLALPSFMDLGELRNYVERVLESIELVEAKHAKSH